MSGPEKTGELNMWLKISETIQMLCKIQCNLALGLFFVDAINHCE